MNGLSRLPRILLPAFLIGCFVAPAWAQVQQAYFPDVQGSYDTAPTAISTIGPVGVTMSPNTMNNRVVWADGSQAVATAQALPVTTSTPTNTVGSFQSSGLAQQKAATAARMGLRGHLGGGLGGARFEGVGWSNRSAQAAIQQCCYWGTRPVSQIGVSRGSDGCWYACVLYR